MVSVTVKPISAVCLKISELGDIPGMVFGSCKMTIPSGLKNPSIRVQTPKPKSSNAFLTCSCIIFKSAKLASIGILFRVALDLYLALKSKTSTESSIIISVGGSATDSPSGV